MEFFNHINMAQKIKLRVISKLVVFHLLILSLLMSFVFAQDINIDVGNLTYDENRRLQVLDFGEFKVEEKATQSIHFKPDSKLVIERISVTGDFQLLSPESDLNPKRNSTIVIEFNSQCKQGEYIGEVEIIDPETPGAALPFIPRRHELLRTCIAVC